jgi:ABC-2 type transport system ATP-binding protein
VLTVNNLGKKYSNGIWGIENFSIEVSDGEIVCIAGPNGSGKTTVINCVLDVISLTTGEIHYNGIPSKSEEYKKNVAYVSDETLLIDALTGKEYMDFISRMYDLSDDAKRKSLTELFSLGDALNQVISTYSHGMKKKLQVICAFMLDCKTIVLDEPSRGLDIESIISLKKLMKKFVQNGGAILLSTHDLISAENLCDRICIVSRGKKIAEGTAEVLKKKYNGKDLEEVFMKSSLLSERGEKIEKIIDNF